MVFGGLSTGTGREFFVVNTAGEGLHTGLLGHVLDELFVLLLAVAVEFRIGLGREGSHEVFQEGIDRLRVVRHTALVEESAHAVLTVEHTGQELVAREVLGGVLTEDLLFDLGEETRLHVHTGLHTHLVSHFLFVVAGR